VALGLVLVAAYVALGTSGATPAWAFIVASAPFLLAAYGLWRLRHVEIEFGTDGVGYGFGGIHRRVPRAKVMAAEPRDYPAARYMGWGYRLGWERRERAYSVLGCPRGVLLTFLDERGRQCKVFLSSRDPEHAVAALGP
jgi:hypothetical protein